MACNTDNGVNLDSSDGGCWVVFAFRCIYICGYDRAVIQLRFLQFLGILDGLNLMTLFYPICITADVQLGPRPGEKHCGRESSGPVALVGYISVAKTACAECTVDTDVRHSTNGAKRD